MKAVSSFPAELVQLVPGLVLDRYELVCLIARGGMGSVWLARHVGKHGFERLVALKSVLPEHAVHERYRKMFLDEASIAARIQHPNVAGTIDLGEAQGVLYFIMEWVDGDSLLKLRTAVAESKVPFPTSIALRLVSDAAAGLHAAHELGNEAGNCLNLVHRDVSPHNILVSVDGLVKVIDFGIAKARERLSDATKTDELKGKLEYMAPEQAAATQVDRRADVWALGAVLYFLLAGVPPHESDSKVASMMKRMGGSPPPPLPPFVPAAVRAVVSKALLREPAQRYATALELQRALEAAMQSSGGAATSADVAAFVRTHLASSIQRRKEAVQAAVTSANDRQKTNERLSKPLYPSSGRMEVAKERAPSSPALDPENGARGQEPPAGRASSADATSAEAIDLPLGLPRSPRRWIAIAVGAMVLLTVGLVANTMRAREGAASAAVQAPSGAAPPILPVASPLLSPPLVEPVQPSIASTKPASAAVRAEPSINRPAVEAPRSRPVPSASVARPAVTRSVQKPKAVDDGF